MRYQNLEEIVLLGARERDRLSRELHELRGTIRRLEAQLAERANEYRRGYQAGHVAGRRGVTLAERQVVRAGQDAGTDEARPAVRATHPSSARTAIPLHDNAPATVVAARVLDPQEMTP